MTDEQKAAMTKAVLGFGSLEAFARANMNLLLNRARSHFDKLRGDPDASAGGLATFVERVSQNLCVKWHYCAPISGLAFHIGVVGVQRWRRKQMNLRCSYEAIALPETWEKFGEDVRSWLEKEHKDEKGRTYDERSDR